MYTNSKCWERNAYVHTLDSICFNHWLDHGYLHHRKCRVDAYTIINISCDDYTAHTWPKIKRHSEMVKKNFYSEHNHQI